MYIKKLWFESNNNTDSQDLVFDEICTISMETVTYLGLKVGFFVIRNESSLCLYNFLVYVSITKHMLSLLGNWNNASYI